MRSCTPCDRRESLEEVVAAIVVIATIRSSCALEWIATSGRNRVKKKLHVVSSERIGDEVLSRVEEGVHVRDVHEPIEVGLEEGRHGDFPSGVACRKRRVAERNEVSQIAHRSFSFSLASQRSRAEGTTRRLQVQLDATAKQQLMACVPT